MRLYLLIILMDIFLPISRALNYLVAAIVDEVANLLEYQRIQEIETEMGVDFGEGSGSTRTKVAVSVHQVGTVEFSKN